MRKAVFGLLAAGLMAAAACDDTTEPETVTYTISVEGEQFRIRVQDAQAIARLDERMSSNTTGVILGRVATGNGGFNAPWSWHLEPGSIEVPDVTIELCDGLPSYVEENLDDWLDQVGNYCPWGARVVMRTD